MKKYISLLGLAAVLGMQSCDREETYHAGLNHIPHKMEGSDTRRASEAANKMRNQTGSRSRDTGNDDDEPKRDKQHWRTSNDPIRKIRGEIR